MKFNVPETKRIVYYTLCRYINQILDLPLFMSPDRVQCIAGPRHCGKSTLLQQLYNTYEDTAFYKEYLDNEDYNTLYIDVIESDKRIVLVDEICKASQHSQLQFCADVKNLQIASKIVIYTGSVEGVLDNLSNIIGRGSLFNIGILSYVEYLCWTNNLTDPFTKGVNELLNLATNDTFISYLHSLRRVIDKDEYITSVITDTCTSVKNRLLEDLKVDKNDLLKVIRYLSVQQIGVSKKLSPDIKKYGEVDLGLNEKLQAINKEYQSLNKTIKSDCMRLLEAASLLNRSTTGLAISDLNHIPEEEKGNIIENYIFTYPWVLTDYFGDNLNIGDIRPVEDIWVEAITLKNVSNIFEACGKYRSVNGDMEIDIIYRRFLTPLYAIEVKNSKYDNALIKQRKANNTALYLKAKDYIFTYSYSDEQIIQDGDNPKAIPNCELVTMLELYHFYRNIEIYLNQDFIRESPQTPYASILKERLGKILPLAKPTTDTNLFS